MTIPHIIAIAFFVAGPTLVFYASKAPNIPIGGRVPLAAVGFFLLAVALYLVGALG